MNQLLCHLTQLIVVAGTKLQLGRTQSASQTSGCTALGLAARTESCRGDSVGSSDSGDAGG